MAKKAKRSAYLGGFVAVAEMDCCLQSLAGSILREESILQILPWAEKAGVKGLGSNSMSELVEGIVLGSYHHCVFQDTCLGLPQVVLRVGWGVGGRRRRRGHKQTGILGSCEAAKRGTGHVC